MSRCPQCQHDNPPGASFCNGCGARAELTCTQCGQVNPSGSRFCNGCGAKLGDPAPAGPEPRFTSPESYTPRSYREALALAGELGMRPLVAHSHFGLGKLHRRAGEREQAQKTLSKATAMYRDMDMRFWLEQAEAEIKELG